MAEADDPHMKTFCETFKLKHLIKVPTCFKNLINPKCIDIILTNKVHNFQNTATVETGLSDHLKLTVTVLKNEIPKIAPKIIKFRNLVNLDDAGVIMHHLSKLLTQIISHRTKLRNHFLKYPSVCLQNSTQQMC